MLELRILNGLHRGATLPLDAQAVNIGAGDAADVVMADHGIEDDHAQLAPHGDGWLLSSSGGAVYAADHSEALELVELQAGECARVGDIWLCIDWQDAPWQPPPPLPVPEPRFDARAAADEAPAETAAATQDALDSPVPPPRPRGHWRRRGAGALVACVAAMLAATAYALTTRAPLPAPVAPDVRTLDGAAPRSVPKPAGPAAAAAAAAAPVSLDAAALAALFRKRLTDAELINRFDLTLEPNDWSMQANLDDDEAARFERVLNGFIKEHNITFPVRAKAVTAEAMLPFRIGQVISGANAAVVTHDGARLYVGDDYRGVRLVAIAPSRVTFFGKRKIEVIW